VTAAGTGSGTAAGTGSGTAAGTGSGPAAVDPAAAVDHIKVVAQHVDAAKGPVDVVFNKWAVTKASFDPANLEGGTAEIEVDIASLTTGIADRDEHLQSPDLFDAAKFAKATVKVDNVKKVDDKNFTADATFSIHGIEKKVSTKFEVTATTADSVTVKVSQPLNRNDFQVAGVSDTVQSDVVLDVQLTLKKI
jgi:polyisoprenoid-binding protein YceI